MSTDLLLEDEKGGFISLQIRADNTLFLSTDGPEGRMGDLILYPDSEGFEKAEQVISVIQEWIRNSKSHKP